MRTNTIAEFNISSYRFADLCICKLFQSLDKSWIKIKNLDKVLDETGDCGWMTTYLLHPCVEVTICDYNTSQLQTCKPGSSFSCSNHNKLLLNIISHFSSTCCLNIFLCLTDVIIKLQPLTLVLLYQCSTVNITQIAVEMPANLVYISAELPFSEWNLVTIRQLRT